MTETTSSTNPNQEIIQSLLAAKIQEIIAVSTIYQYLAKLYPVIATLDSSSMDFENPTETPPLTSSKPLPLKIPEIKPEDEIVAANSSTDAHGDLLALLQPMFNSGIIKLVGKPEEQGIIYINLKAKDPFAKPLTKAEYNALPDEDKVFCFPIIDVDINTEYKTPYIFLGDALDRGEFSINCLVQLIYILRKQQDLVNKKIIAEKIFTALLGNHEIEYLFKNYQILLYKDFFAKLPGFIEQEILSIEKKEIVDIISDLMWQNIDLFDFCKDVKIKEGTPEEKTYVYSHANLPLWKIKDFLSQTEKLDMDINGIMSKDEKDINWSELNKLFKDALKEYQNTNRLKILYNTASKSELEEDEQKTLYCILSSFCSTRPEECVAGYYYKSPNIINITGHTIRVEITCENLLYILTDTGSSYWFRVNCPYLNTIPSSTSLTQSGNVYMNFYDELSLKQNTDGKYLVKIIPNTAEKKLIYSALPITKTNTSSEVAKILTPDDYFNFFETTKIDEFNVMSHFSKLKTYFKTLSTYKNEDKIKHITKIREIIPIILQKALTKREIEEFQEEFNKKHSYNPVEICKYFSDQCSNECLTLNLDDVKKYCSTMFKLLNDDGSYKEELTYVCSEHTYKSSEVFSTLFNTINTSLLITTEIERNHKEQLQEIFRLNIDNQELRKQAKNEFQQFLKNLEKEKQASQPIIIFS